MGVLALVDILGWRDGEGGGVEEEEGSVLGYMLRGRRRWGECGVRMRGMEGI